MQFYSVTDLIFGPVILAIILFVGKAYSTKRLNESKDENYRYYYKGLLLKISGGLSLCLVYTFYYPGGDTLQYYNDGLCFVRLIFEDFPGFVKVFFSKHDISDISYFSLETGYPAYFRDAETWFAVKVISFFVLLSVQSYLVATFLLASVSFLGIWKLYLVFVYEYPELRKQFAIAIFFIPSVFFWGSGILKDTITFSCLGYFVSSYHMIFIKRDKILINLFLLFFSAFIIISIKPYIFIGILPGLVFWLVQRILSNIKGQMAKIAAIPILIFMSLFAGYVLLNLLSTQLADYQLDSVLDKAVVMQRDLKMDYYKGNSFDIGEFDSSIGSMLKKAPQAIFATLFRPMLFEANNTVMFLSSIENLILLILFIKTLLSVGIFNYLRICFSNHLLIFCTIFTLFFAFSIGLSTSNFGSLVRYKIPCIPFFVASLFIVRHIRKLEVDKKKNVIQYSSLSDSISSV